MKSKQDNHNSFLTINEMVSFFSFDRRFSNRNLHKFTEKRIEYLISKIDNSLVTICEPVGVIGGRNDIICFNFLGKTLLFEIFCSISLVDKDLRLLEQTKANIKIAIIADDIFSQKSILSDYLRSKPVNPFPFIMLSEIFLRGLEENTIEKLTTIIEPLTIDFVSKNSKKLSLIVKKHFKNKRLIENIACEDIKTMDFRGDWQPIVNKLVSDTTYKLRAMVFDVELGKWWEKTAGKLYMMTNLELLSKKVNVNRVFIFSSMDFRIRKNALLHAFIHYKIGVDVRICNVNVLYDQFPFSANMFSVHDDTFLALYYFYSDSAIVNLIFNGAEIKDFVGFYDEVFNDLNLCKKMNEILDEFKPPLDFFEEANKQIKYLYKLYNTNSIVDFLKII